MTRCSDGMDPCVLDRLAQKAGVKLVERRGLCQHGYTRDETCVDCEGGYVTYVHVFARLGEYATGPNGENGYAVSDDCEWVAYWPARLAGKFHAVLTAPRNHDGTPFDFVREIDQRI